MVIQALDAREEAFRKEHESDTEEQLLRRIEELCPEASIALELMKTRSSVEWLMEEGIL